MCWCQPHIRTPFCGSFQCHPPAKPVTNVNAQATYDKLKGDGWIGVDLDGTLADHDDNWDGGIGAPVAHMVNRVKVWLKAGITVRILTARVHPDWDQDHKHLDAIKDWCLEIFGQRLAVTCMKDPNMLELWDDRATHVVRNTGLTLHELSMFKHQLQHHQGCSHTNGK